MGAEGVFEELFQRLAGDPDFEYGILIRAHRHGAGAKGGRKIRLLALILSLYGPNQSGYALGHIETAATEAGHQRVMELGDEVAG
jgi:hypothetical protein